VTLPLPIMFSLARTAYVVCLGIIIVLAIVSRRGWLFWMLIIFLLLSPFILPKAVINRALYSFQDRRYFGFLDPSSAYRILIWKKAWWFIVNHPIFGGGLTRENVIDSQYARVIIETGIVGFILFSWLLCRLVKLGVRLFKAIPDDWIKGLAVGFIACVSGLIVSGFAAITFNIVRIMEPFWALAALTAYLLYFINTQRENPAEIKAVNKI
jgi:O-antigen ligase